MLQTDDCVILVQGHKMPTSVFSFLKFSNCCRNTNLDYTIQTKSYYFTIICSKLRKGPNTVLYCSCSNTTFLELAPQDSCQNTLTYIYVCSKPCQAINGMPSRSSMCVRYVSGLVSMYVSLSVSQSLIL